MNHPMSKIRTLWKPSYDFAAIRLARIICRCAREILRDVRVFSWTFHFTSHGFHFQNKIFFSEKDKADGKEIENIRNLRPETFLQRDMKRRKRSISVPGPAANDLSSPSASARTSGNIPKSECFDPSLVGMIVPPHVNNFSLKIFAKEKKIIKFSISD